MRRVRPITIVVFILILVGTFFVCHYLNKKIPDNHIPTLALLIAILSLLLFLLIGSVQFKRDNKLEEYDSTTMSISTRPLFGWFGGQFNRATFSLKMFQDGYFNYRVPDDMKVGIIKSVFAEIFIDEKILEEIEDKHHIRKITVSPSMKVKLLGEDKKFSIVSKGSEEQAVLSIGTTRWEWSVKPLKSGLHTLEFIATMVVKMDDGRLASKDLETHKEIVLVKVNRSHVIKDWFKTNWQWLIGLIFGSGILFAALKAFKVLP